MNIFLPSKLSVFFVAEQLQILALLGLEIAAMYVTWKLNYSNDGSGQSMLALDDTTKVPHRACDGCRAKKVRINTLLYSLRTSAICICS